MSYRLQKLVAELRIKSSPLDFQLFSSHLGMVTMYYQQRNTINGNFISQARNRRDLSQHKVFILTDTTDVLLLVNTENLQSSLKEFKTAVY